MLMIIILNMQVAFKTGDYRQQVIFIGGLTDGFLATEYVTLPVNFFSFCGDILSPIPMFVCVTRLHLMHDFHSE